MWTEGQVIDQNPQAFDRVPADSAVDIVVSSGLGTVIVDDVVCLPYGQAKSRLERAGLVVVLGEPVTPNPVCPNLNRVAAQDPGGGSEVEPGSTVTLFTAAPPEEGG